MNILFIIKVNIKWWYRSPCPFLPHNQHARFVAMVLNILWTRTPISFEHMSIWFELLYLRLTTHHSYMVVRLGQVTMKGLLPLHKVCGQQLWSHENLLLQASKLDLRCRGYKRSKWKKMFLLFFLIFFFYGDDHSVLPIVLTTILRTVSLIWACRSISL